MGEKKYKKVKNKKRGKKVEEKDRGGNFCARIEKKKLGRKVRMVERRNEKERRKERKRRKKKSKYLRPEKS